MATYRERGPVAFGERQADNKEINRRKSVETRIIRTITCIKMVILQSEW